MSHDIEKYEKISKELRRDIVSMIYHMQSGHPGGSLSMIDTLTVLYFGAMKYDPQHPDDPDRDRFILSKGHAAPGLYVTLAKAGFFPKEWLFDSYRKVNAKLQGHPDMKKTPGVEMTSGSLGMGLSAANGMAIAGKLHKKDYRVYVMMGDGEMDEGQIWEAAATARHYKLDNLIGFVDLNGLQNDAQTSAVKYKGNVAEKWRAFGWNVYEIDGHDFEQICTAIDEAKKTKGIPSVIILHTVKGKGISYMENVVEFHGDSPNEEQYKQAMKELA